MKQFITLTLKTYYLALTLFLMTFSTIAQPFEVIEEVIILKVDIKEKFIIVDFVDRSDNFIEQRRLPDSLIRSTGERISIEKLRAGSNALLIGIKHNHKIDYHSVKMKTNWEGENLKLEGMMEYYDSLSNLATVDGRKAKLDNGVKIQGRSKYLEKEYNDFSSITPGNFLSIYGTRQSNGSILASNAFVTENEFSSYQSMLNASMNSKYSNSDMTRVEVPEHLRKYAEYLEKGYAQFGDLQLKIFDNLEVQAFVNKVGNRLIPGWQKNIADTIADKIKFHFYVIDSPIPNAYALPNGSVFIHSGLLKILENEAQLAAILSHEMAHLSHEHPAEKLKREETKKKIGIITKIVFKLAFRKNNPNNILLAANLATDFYDGGTANALKLVEAISALTPEAKSLLLGTLEGLDGFAYGLYNQKNEEQADRAGLSYMELAGYDITEAAKVRKVIMDNSGEKSFSNDIGDATLAWLGREDMYKTENMIGSFSQVITSKLVDRATNNWFCSHPMAISRYRNTNYSIAADYQLKDWTGSYVGKEEFLKIKNELTR